MALSDFINQETLTNTNANTPSTSKVSEAPGPIQGVGGGLADLVPATISNEQTGEQQPAALSEGEFVWPADVVSMLGDGSSEAGARILGNLMNKIREVKSKSGGKQAKGIAELLG